VPALGRYRRGSAIECLPNVACGLPLVKFSESRRQAEIKLLWLKGMGLRGWVGGGGRGRGSLLIARCSSPLRSSEHLKI
jgi:hypothetical protein